MFVICFSILNSVVLFLFLVLFLFFLVFMPFIFFDSFSFLLGLLVILMLLFILVCLSVFDIFYFKDSLISLIFLVLFCILFLGFYFYDFLLFYLMFEFSVIPIFFYIFSWGGDMSKIFAGFYLFFFTFFSSLIFFLGLFFIWNLIGTFNFYVMFNVSFFFIDSFHLYLMLIVFFVKMPIFVFHIWLPLAHLESPMIGSMVLASLMLKLGGYGMLRMIMVFFLNYLITKLYFFVWGLLGGIIMSIVCFSQVDMKKIVAFSSVSHMSMILMSSFSMHYLGKWGFFCVMLGHGILSSLMFYGLGVLYYRFFTRNLFSLSSLILIIPSFGLWWFLIGIMNLGFPPFISFFMEFFIFISMILVSSNFLLFGFVFIMCSSFYTVNMMIYVISGLKKSLNVHFNLTLSENLIFFIHLYFMVFSVFFYWAV